MRRLLLIGIFTGLFFANTFAQVAHETDAIQNKAVVVLPVVTKAQLELLKTEFGKYKQIKSAVYVYKSHNCLLMDIKPGDEIIFFSDLLKIISMHIPQKDMILKESKAYDEIYNRDFEGNDFVLK